MLQRRTFQILSTRAHRAHYWILIAFLSTFIFFLFSSQTWRGSKCGWTSPHRAVSTWQLPGYGTPQPGWTPCKIGYLLAVSSVGIFILFQVFILNFDSNIHLSDPLALYLPMCLHTYLIFCPSVCLCIYLSIYLSTYLSVCHSMFQPIYLFTFLSIYTYFYQSVFLSIYLFVSLLPINLS